MLFDQDRLLANITRKYIFKRLVVEENCCERGITLLCQQHTFTFGDIEGQHVLLRPLEEPVDFLLNFNL